MQVPVIERAVAPTDEVRTLVEALEGELAANYPPEQRHGLSLDAIFQPSIRFFVARVDGAAVGCGGIALYHDFAEVKRMYVRPDSRGKGVADAIIGRLESEACGTGLSLLKLETGIHQPAALRFYERCGFRRCPIFEPYASKPPETIVASVFLEKPISTP
ncbi:GNAT family N-acetyltransferase [soil metagenome]